MAPVIVRMRVHVAHVYMLRCAVGSGGHGWYHPEIRTCAGCVMSVYVCAVPQYRSCTSSFLNPRRMALWGLLGKL